MNASMMLMDKIETKHRKIVNAADADETASHIISECSKKIRSEKGLLNHRHDCVSRPQGKDKG